MQPRESVGGQYCYYQREDGCARRLDHYVDERTADASCSIGGLRPCTKKSFVAHNSWVGREPLYRYLLGCRVGRQAGLERPVDREQGPDSDYGEPHSARRAPSTTSALGGPAH